MYMENLNKTDIGLIGLAVMGENLALNMADKGWNVSVYNRTVPGVEEGVVERFINGRAKGKVFRAIRIFQISYLPSRLPARS